MASHQMLTDALSDADPAERQQGIEAGFAWRAAAEATVVYADHGLSGGMRAGIAHAMRDPDHEIQFRYIGEERTEDRLRVDPTPHEFPGVITVLEAEQRAERWRRCRWGRAECATAGKGCGCDY